MNSAFETCYSDLLQCHTLTTRGSNISAAPVSLSLLKLLISFENFGIRNYEECTVKRDQNSHVFSNSNLVTNISTSETSKDKKAGTSSGSRTHEIIIEKQLCLSFLKLWWRMKTQRAEGDSEPRFDGGLWVSRRPASGDGGGTCQMTRGDGDQVGCVILTVWNSCELFADRYKQLLFLVMESN